MTDDEMELYDKHQEEAVTDGDKIHQFLLFSGHLMRCMNSTNKETKAVRRDLETFKDEARGDLQDLQLKLEEMKTETHKSLKNLVDRMMSLHSAPKFSEDKLEWLKNNWTWLVVLLWIAQDKLGILLWEVFKKWIDK